MRDEFDEVETIDRNPKSWVAWKREAERLQRIIDGMALAAMDSEPSRNPVLAYADSYRDMAKQGVESVPIWSVITDLERNIAPLYRHAQQPVVPDAYVRDERGIMMLNGVCEPKIGFGSGRNACRAAMLAAAPQPQNAPQNIPEIIPGWIQVSERMPEDRISVILWDAEIGEVTSGHYSHKTQTFYHCGDAIENEITHWMPPPCAPQEVKGEHQIRDEMDMGARITSRRFKV